MAFVFCTVLLESPLVAALNHLLEAEPWARERLAPFAGRLLELRAPPLPALRIALRSDGLLDAAPGDAGEPTLVLTLRPEVLPAAARGMDHLVRAVETTGDAALAAEVLYLVRHLRWEAEEDLSRLVGDAAAHRIASLARDLARWHLEGAQRLAEGLVEYAVDEAKLLVPRGELDQLAAANARLRDALERLEKRIEQLGAAS